ncbi:MAG: MATE family efflux transporter [Opitutaceae bacterium]|nr:MATE family efflux transporter [Opitutaceae bacterium]
MPQHALRTESLFQLAWPIFLQNATHSVVVLVDMWFFAHLSDKIAGTVGAVIPIIWMGAFVIPVFAGTGVSVASQYMGAKQYDKVVPTYMMNLCCTATMGALFGLGVWMFSDQIGVWMGLTHELQPIASSYLGGMSVYFVFMGVLVAYNAVLSSRGMTQWLMYNSFVVASVNLGLASLFVLGFGWGLRGVVTASCISVGAALLLSMRWVHLRLEIRFHLKGAVRDMLGVVRPMLRIGVSNALEPFSYSVQQILLSTIVISLGVTAMASHNYAGRAQMFQVTFSVTLALASQILMGHWMGARRFEDVDRLFWKVIRATTTVALVYATGVWLFGAAVIGIFTTDPAMITLGKSLLLVAVFYEPARAVNIVSGFALKTVGDARFPLIVGMTFIWGILPVIFAVNRLHPLSLVGLWMFFAADEIIRAFINLWRWRSGRWRSMGITVVDPHADPATIEPLAGEAQA